ncbi:MAG: hypothetical protein R3F30_02365 [Planctomycetota bacterium]
MPEARIQNLLLAMLCVLVGLSWLTRPEAGPVGATLLPAQSGGAGAAGAGDADLARRFDALLTELRELRLALGRRAGTGGGGAAPREPIEEEAVTPTGSEAMAAVLARLERLVAVAAPGAGRAPMRMWSGQTPPEPDPGVWRDFERSTLARYRDSEDPQAEELAGRSLNFLTYAEVLARFGPPTSIAAKGSGQTWCYDFGERGYYVQFNDGFVTRLDF